MPYFGSFALLCALALSLYSLVVGGIALLRDNTPSRFLSETARRAGIASFLAVLAAAVALVWSAFRDDFSVAYILHHSNRDLPLPYKFAVLWSGQEGSLLLWALLLTGYGFVLRLRHKVDIRLTAHASVILAGVQVFFLLLLNVAATPFSLVRGPIPPDGDGLNPLLQYTEMVIHPPMLYLGYVGMTIPFAFGLAALIMRYPGEKWIHITRRWTMVTWMFLTCGIFLGSHWAYVVLGWGGYWGWDPVENASLMPWLTATAFLHSVMMQEKRGMMKVWNVWLVFATFILSILGTWLTRSGVINSVHAFAQSPIGAWFLIFLIIVFAVCLFFFIKNRSHLKSENRLESLISRESSFLFNNQLLLASCFAILWGTFFPVLSEWVTDNKITVGPPFYNHVNVPIALCLLLLTAVGPLLAWRRTSFASLKRNFTIPVAIAVAVAIALVAGGMRPWEDLAYLYALMAISLSVLVTATVASEFLRGARVISSHSGSNIVSSIVQLWRRNTRRYGGYVVHLGVIVAVIGLAGSAFNQNKEQDMGEGDKMQIGAYTLTFGSPTNDSKPNEDLDSAIIDVARNGRHLTTLYPTRHCFKASGQPNTIPSIRSNVLEDLYIINAGRSDGVRDCGLSDIGVPGQRYRRVINAHVNPLVSWLWVGWLMIVAGTLLALVPSEAAVRVAQPVAVRATTADVTVATSPGAGD
jgi:cytochrome c-type biogenesis protein CcmF